MSGRWRGLESRLGRGRGQRRRKSVSCRRRPHHEGSTGKTGVSKGLERRVIIYMQGRMVIVRVAPKAFHILLRTVPPSMTSAISTLETNSVLRGEWPSGRGIQR